MNTFDFDDVKVSTPVQTSNNPNKIEAEFGGTPYIHLVGLEYAGPTDESSARLKFNLEKRAPGQSPQLQSFMIFDWTTNQNPREGEANVQTKRIVNILSTYRSDLSEAEIKKLLSFKEDGVTRKSWAEVMETVANSMPPNMADLETTWWLTMKYKSTYLEIGRQFYVVKAGKGSFKMNPIYDKVTPDVVVPDQFTPQVGSVTVQNPVPFTKSETPDDDLPF